ncbi:MAG: hypothetical protein ACTTJV_06700 [Ottowia sp.]
MEHPAGTGALKQVPKAWPRCAQQGEIRFIRVITNAPARKGPAFTQNHFTQNHPRRAGRPSVFSEKSSKPCFLKMRNLRLVLNHHLAPVFHFHAHARKSLGN